MAAIPNDVYGLTIVVNNTRSTETMTHALSTLAFMEFLTEPVADLSICLSLLQCKSWKKVAVLHFI